MAQMALVAHLAEVAQHVAHLSRYVPGSASSGMRHVTVAWDTGDKMPPGRSHLRAISRMHETVAGM